MRNKQSNLTIQHLLGENFEIYFHNIFPNLIRYSQNEQIKNNLSDFESDKFFIEAKSGFQAGDRGVRIKDSQIIRSKEYNKPTIYVIGYHSFKNSLKILSKYKSTYGKRKKIQKEMKITALYLVDLEIIEVIANSRTKICQKRGKPYFSLRHGYLEQLISNSIRGSEISAQEFYGFSKPINHFDLINMPSQIYRSKYLGNNCEVLNFLKENEKLL